MEGLTKRGWFDAHAEKEAKRDRIRMSERIGSLIGVIITIVVLWYFAAEFTGGTGFFTSSFGTVDQILFFGGFIVGMAPTLARFVLGKRNAARPFDIVSTGFFVFIAIWFLVTFPFDFSHLADMLPSSLQFLLSWITNDFVKALMVLGIIVSVIMIVYTTLLYLAVRKKLKTQTIVA